MSDSIKSIAETNLVKKLNNRMTIFALANLLLAVTPAFARAQAPSCAAVFVKEDLILSVSEATTREYQKNFARMFHETSGMDNYAAYEKMIRSRTEPEIIKAIEIFDKHQVEVSIRAPEEVREAIATSGFKNTFETGTNAGKERPATKWRDEVEAHVFGFNLSEYAQLPAAAKPKYGSLQPKQESGLISRTEGLAPYGSDSYQLKTEKISSRLTFTMDDSSSVTPMIPITATTKDWFDSVQKGRTWHNAAIPWNQRLLAAPFLARAIQHGNLFMSTSFNSAYKMNLEGPKVENGSAYIEAQIFGKIDLDTVSSFMFAKTPPSGQFLVELKKRNITILDGRSQPAREWSE
ncbi:DUF3626 domain-containing protein [Bdellovibrio sp. HCB209]|uniref:DUF3626 domain-containing protein n=1 Tax=Bdellovibrio sp. HCB209 TaxID=3394354 RepID=UPI0039B65ECA